MSNQLKGFSLPELALQGVSVHFIVMLKLFDVPFMLMFQINTCYVDFMGQQKLVIHLTTSSIDNSIIFAFPNFSFKLQDSV